MNSLGQIFKITTWGESHGKAMGVVIENCPSGLALTEKELTAYLAESDRPLLQLATSRHEPNQVKLLSGVDQGKTIGTPISIIIENRDYNKQDYQEINQIFRPGHGDYTYYAKYGSPYQSGGGRASGRECITRMAAGYIAEKIIRYYFTSFSITTQLTCLAGIEIIDDASYQSALQRALDIARQGDSTGGQIKVTINGLPAGLGEPVFHGLDSQLTAALMSIGAVKSVTIGDGSLCPYLTGSQYNDDFMLKDSQIGFQSNHNGGILAGISNGASIGLLLMVKPTPSIQLPKMGLTADKRLKIISVKGRHDKNITPRIMPIARAMSSLVLVDHLMISSKIGKDMLHENKKFTPIS